MLYSYQMVHQIFIELFQFLQMKLILTNNLNWLFIISENLEKQQHQF